MRFVDLFAGCGGLSLGMERAGGELVAAVEKSDMAARTFHHNYVGDACDERSWRRYVDSCLASQVEGRVVVNELASVLADPWAMSRFAAYELDAVVGGPPCQGFSMAGRRRKDDLRNRLAWEYLDFVNVTQPKAVVIENVVGMSNSFLPGEDSSFIQLQRALSKQGLGYVVQAVHVNAMHYGAPQHRPRLMLIALRQDVAEKVGVWVTDEVWRSNFQDLAADLPPLAPRPTVKSGHEYTIRDAISDLDGWENEERGRNEVYLAQLRGAESALRHDPSAPRRRRNHTYRSHTERVTTRFSYYRALLANDVDQRLLSQLDEDDESARVEAKRELEKVQLPLELETDRRSGERRRIDSLDQLVELALELRTRKHSQKALKADRPARTVVTLPDDYIHPKVSRIFTVRELARFQGFPDTFEFLGKETTGAHRRKVEVPQYTQVGNAVSPWQAYAVGRLLKGLLDEYERATALSLGPHA